jgi:cytosine deaminase
MLDLLIQNATLPDGRKGVCVAVQDGRIVEVSSNLSAQAHERLDAQGQLLSPPFVDAHFHMDATLSFGLPRVNQSGTLLEGISLWGELKPMLTHDALVKRAMAYCDWAVDVVGGIPHFERTMADGALSVKLLCELAAHRGLRVDMHCDESDDPLSRHIETLTYETQRLGMQGRVTGSHLTSMHSMDNYYVSKLIPLMAEADIQVISNPLINITLQGRHDTYPKRRGLTRVPELLAAGINVAFGQDCVMDPWYSLGSGDMLEVAHMGLHVAQMTSQAAMRQCFEAVTQNPARVLGLEGYGIRAGCYADFVLLQASDPVEAIRLRANRLRVYRRGKLIAQSPETVSTLHMPGRPSNTAMKHDSIPLSD